MPFGVNRPGIKATAAHPYPHILCCPFPPPPPRGHDLTTIEHYMTFIFTLNRTPTHNNAHCTVAVFSIQLAWNSQSHVFPDYSQTPSRRTRKGPYKLSVLTGSSWTGHVI